MFRWNSLLSAGTNCGTSPDKCKSLESLSIVFFAQSWYASLIRIESACLQRKKNVLPCFQPSSNRLHKLLPLLGFFIILLVSKHFREDTAKV